MAEAGKDQEAQLVEDSYEDDVGTPHYPTQRDMEIESQWRVQAAEASPENAETPVAASSHGTPSTPAVPEPADAEKKQFQMLFEMVLKKKNAISRRCFSKEGC